jgi:hypothetical protein
MALYDLGYGSGAGRDNFVIAGMLSRYGGMAGLADEFRKGTLTLGWLGQAMPDPSMIVPDTSFVMPPDVYLTVTGGMDPYVPFDPSAPITPDFAVVSPPPEYMYPMGAGVDPASVAASSMYPDPTLTDPLGAPGVTPADVAAATTTPTASGAGTVTYDPSLDFPGGTPTGNPATDFPWSAAAQALMKTLITQGVPAAAAAYRALNQYPTANSAAARAGTGTPFMQRTISVPVLGNVSLPLAALAGIGAYLMFTGKDSRRHHRNPRRRYRRR